MRALVLNDESLAEINRVKYYAKNHPYTLADIRRVMEGGLPPAGDLPEYKCCIPVGFKVVFSFEQQPCGLCRHLSVSVDDEAKVPHPEAIKMLMKEFDFNWTFEECAERGAIWLESIPDGEGKAVNIVEQVL